MNDKDVNAITQSNGKTGRDYSSINLQLKPLAETSPQVKRVFQLAINAFYENS